MKLTISEIESVTRTIDNGFSRITAAEALELCDGSRPAYGYEKAVELPSGVKLWIARTNHNGNTIWTARRR